MKLIGWCKVIGIKAVWILTGLAQRHDDSLLQPSLAVVLGYIRFECHVRLPEIFLPEKLSPPLPWAPVERHGFMLASLRWRQNAVCLPQARPPFGG